MNEESHRRSHALPCFRRSRDARRGYSFLEVMISLIILISGILAILNFFPFSLQTVARAELLSEATLLAQQKAEEIRRDDDAAGALVGAIRLRATATTPIPFPEDERLTYGFSGRSSLDPTDDPGNPDDDYFVPRVILAYNRNFRPGGDVIYELRFDR